MSTPFDDIVNQASQAGWEPPQEAPPDAQDSSFARGLRSGTTSLGGQLRGLAGGVGDTLGATDFARDQYAASKAAQIQAGQEAPPVSSYKDVHDLRSFFDYTTGLAGQSVPLAAGALGAAALARTPARALMGATALTAPFEIGGVLQKSQDDPEAMKKSAGDRMLNATAVGTGRALLSNIVPAAAGGQLMGKAASAGGKQFLDTVGTNIVKDAAGNAIAGAASEKLGQIGESQLNPNRDTSKDLSAMKEAAVGGGVIGGGFGAVGGVGEAMHAKSVRAADLDTARKIAADEPLQPTTDAAGVAASDKTASEKAGAYAQELMSDTSIPDDIKAKVQQAAQNLGDATNRAYIASQKVATDISAKVKDLYEQVSSKASSEPPSSVDPAQPDAKKSEDYSGVRSQISDIIMPVLEKQSPELTANPNNVKLLADTMRYVIDTMRSGDRLDRTVVDKLHDFFGDSLPDTLHSIHEAVLGVEPSKGQATFYNSLNRLSDKARKNNVMNDVVSKNLVDDSATTGQVKELVDQLRNHVSRPPVSKGVGVEGEANAARRTFLDSQLDAGLTKTFGANKGKVLDAFRQEHEGERTAQQRLDDNTQSKEAAAESSITDHSAEEGADLKGEYEPPQVYGGTKDNPFVPSHEAHVRDFGNDKSQADRLLSQARTENPDRNVGFVKAKDYAAENNISPEQLHAMTKGKPGDHGVVVAEGMKQEGRLTPEQAQKMKLDSKSHANSESRIDTDKGALDAIKVTKETLKTMERVAGETGPQRDARAFLEGLGGAADALGAKIKNLSDDTVIARRGGKNVTVGDVKKTVLERGASDADGRSDSTDTADIKTGLAKAEAKKVEIEKAAESATGGALEKLRKDWAFQNGLTKMYEGVLEDRAQAGALDKTKEAEGRRGVEKDENIHRAAAEYGDQPAFNGEENPTGSMDTPLRIEKGLDGQPIDYARAGPKPLGKDNKLTLAGKIDLAKRFESLKGGLAEKGDALLDKVYAMSATDHVRLADVLKSDNHPLIAKIIKELTAKYEKTAPFDRRFDAVVEKVAAGGEGLNQVINRVKQSNNALGMQRSVEALLTASKLHEPDSAEGKNFSKAIEATNDRLSKLVKDDPTLAYGMQLKNAQEVNTNKTISDTTKKDISDYINKVAPHLAVEFAKIMHAGEFNPKVGEGLIRVSVHALDPMGTAYHEAMHSLFKTLRDQANFASVKTLYKAAESAHVMGQLRKLLKDSPEALKQIEANKEERAAYMYQFWAKDQLTVGPHTKDFFTKIKDMVLKTLGIWSNDHRAEHIMDYFHQGEFAKISGDRNAVSRALMEPGTNKFIESTYQVLHPLKKLEMAVFGAGSSKMRDTQNPALAKIADLMQPNTHGTTHDEGWIPSSRAERTQRLNTLVGKLKGVSEADIESAHLALREGRPGDTPAERQVVTAVRDLLDGMHDYQRGAGVDIGDLGKGKDYFPRVWDAEFISKNQDKFKEMINRYVASGNFKGDVNKVMNKLMARDGAEQGVSIDLPGMQHTKERKLDFITGPDAAPFLQKSLIQTINTYVTQGTRRAEWARRFKDDGSGLKGLLKEAVDVHGATPDEMAVAGRFIQGVDGTLGDNINPTLRRYIGNTIAYQNIRLLPLMVFSSLVDPLGITVRGGTVGDAFSAFKRGVMEIPRGFKKENHSDQWYQLAQDMGTIDDTALVHTLGSSYSQGMVSTAARKANDMLFKLNLGEQFNTSMRVSATQAASKFLARHADGTYNVHSTRWLAELGLKPNEIVVKDGQPLLTTNDFIQHGYSEEKATLASNKMRHALNQWVDGAILRPNAADRPIWFNDPHFALFSHLKQFTYAFQHTILNRVGNELRHGNYTPAMALASYVPTMFAADLLRGFIQGGGQQPDWKEGWGFKEYFSNAVERSGLYGVGQFPSDFVKDLKHGGMGIGAVSGPSLEQLIEGLQTVGGHEQFKTFLSKSMPATILLPLLTGGKSVPDTKFSE